MIWFMKTFKLTTDETNALRRAHRLTKNKRAADRMKAVYLLSRGKSAREIAEVLMLDEDSIGNYRKRYEGGGIEALLTDDYKGSETLLSISELNELSTHIEKNSYLTVESIVDYVKATYNVTYSISGMRQLLHRLDFVYKKAKSIPGKANAELQRAYQATLEETLKNKAEQDAHYYLDGAHPQHNTQIAYGWIKKGKDKLIKANSGRQRININGALNSETLEVVMRTDDSINTQSTLKLFEQLEQKHPEANVIYITLDNAKYYKNQLVMEYLKNSKIKLLFMPAYSPNLNLIERLWKFMRKTILYNQYYEKFADFKMAVMNFFENLDDHKPKLATLLTKNFQIFEAAA